MVAKAARRRPQSRSARTTDRRCGWRRTRHWPSAARSRGWRPGPLAAGRPRDGRLADGRGMTLSLPARSPARGWRAGGGFGALTDRPPADARCPYACRDRAQPQDQEDRDQADQDDVVVLPTMALRQPAPQCRCNLHRPRMGKGQGKRPAASRTRFGRQSSAFSSHRLARWPRAADGRRATTERARRSPMRRPTQTLEKTGISGARREQRQHALLLVVAAPPPDRRDSRPAGRCRGCGRARRRAAAAARG